MPSEARLNAHVEHALCDLVREGIPLVDAAHALGITPRTVYRWIERADDEHPAHARLVDGLQAARASASIASRLRSLTRRHIATSLRRLADRSAWSPDEERRDLGRASA